MYVSNNQVSKIHCLSDSRTEDLVYYIMTPNVLAMILYTLYVYFGWQKEM